MELGRATVLITFLFLIFIFFIVPAFSLFIIHHLISKKRTAAQANMKTSAAEPSN